jgi:hypothetical protein
VLQRPLESACPRPAPALPARRASWLRGRRASYARGKQLLRREAAWATQWQSTRPWTPTRVIPSSPMRSRAERRPTSKGVVRSAGRGRALHAYSGHADAVTAFLRDSEATGPVTRRPMSLRSAMRRGRAETPPRINCLRRSCKSLASTATAPRSMWAVLAARKGRIAPFLKLRGIPRNRHSTAMRPARRPPALAQRSGSGCLLGGVVFDRPSKRSPCSDHVVPSRQGQASDRRGWRRRWPVAIEWGWAGQGSIVGCVDCARELHGRG